MFKTLSLTIIAFVLHLNPIAFADKPPLENLPEENIATPENLQSFKLITPKLTAEEQKDYENGLKAEEDEAYQKSLYSHLINRTIKQKEEEEDDDYDYDYDYDYEDKDETEEDATPNTNHSSDLINRTSSRIFGNFNQNSPSSNSTPTSTITVEIYQNAPSIGKQFLLARENGMIRFVFAISAGTANHKTPEGEFQVIKPQLWRHMSSKYPSKKENNMDHLTYFKPMYGFHATTFGAYQKIGEADSHGCVRLPRPQSRAVYKLIKSNGSEATIVSYRQKKDPPEEEIQLIKEQLALDFNLIQKMILTHNNGDIPFNEKEYDDFKASKTNLESKGPILKKMGIKEIIEISLDQDLSKLS